MSKAIGFCGMVVFVMLLTGSVAWAGTASSNEVSLKVLSYNVWALPKPFSGKSPEKRIAQIADIASVDIDIGAFQEHFDFGNVFRRALTEDSFEIYRGTGTKAPRRFHDRVFTFFLSLFSRPIIGQDLPLGSGLTTVVRRRSDIGSEFLVKERFKRCDGLVRNRLDCLATKGILGVRLTLLGGKELDVYNIHLDSPGKSRSIKVRTSQLSHVERIVMQYSEGRALLIAGDFNSSFCKENEATLLREFQSRLGLTDASTDEVLRGSGRKVDFIWYREGIDLKPELDTNASVDKGAAFVSSDGKKTLSDHPPVFAAFKFVPREL